MDIELLGESSKKQRVDYILLTIGLIGIQFTWTVEMAYGTPYLLSLGVSKSFTALVWLAGPLSGLLVQPIVGVYSDSCQLPMGRRRPFIIVGGLLVLLSMLLIAFSKEISLDYAYLIAVFAFYLLDFSINAVQASFRSLLVDVCSTREQDPANIWAGRMVGIGNVLGYFVGFLDLEKYFPGTQVQILCLIAMMSFISTVATTCIYVKETPNHDGAVTHWSEPLSGLIDSMKNIPIPVQQLFRVQFLSWLGWFPFCFYSTSWVMNDSEDPRVGSLSLLFYSVISLITGIVLPMTKHHLGLEMNQLWALGLFSFTGILFTSLLWDQRLVLVALCGFSWAVCIWVPFTLLGEVISNDNNVGVILGIHNIFIVLPQFISTLACSILFSFLTHDPFGWAIRIGSIASVLAAIYALKLKQIKTFL